MATAAVPRQCPAPSPAITAYRDLHAGETIIVCGCGPSLHELPDPAHHLTIGVNDVGRLFDPTYLVVVNPRNQFAADRFRYVEQSNAGALFTHLDLGPLRPPVVRFRLGSYAGTSISADGSLHYTQNSPYVAVCLAAFMGARRIGLIGVDLGDHHFFAHTGRHPLASRLREIDAQYGRLAESLRARDIDLVNLSAASRLSSLPRAEVAAFLDTRPPAIECERLRIVSYATTPVAGVPAILARCIAARTSHAARCVWPTRSYGNGVAFEGDLQWTDQPREAERTLAEADVVIAHNGKIDPRHTRLIGQTPVVTLAHNYMWNVDRTFERRGLPALVVGQYQATLPEFGAWTVTPNPVPLWEESFSPGDKGDVVTICYTPSGRHERYPAGHRLYWHAKGYDTTMRVLDRLAASGTVKLEVVRDRQISHAESLAMKRRSHIVIDECVTGSYHRNSLEGLATGCVVVNGVGLLPGVVEALRRCAPGAGQLPFVFGDLTSLEGVLRELVERGAADLIERGRASRAWMERHWAFDDQWARFWEPALQRARAMTRPTHPPTLPSRRRIHPHEKPAMPIHAAHEVSVVIPHAGADRLPQLRASLAALRQIKEVGEVIVVEMGEYAVAGSVAERWADAHLFIEHGGPFERARALNAGAALATREVVLWHDNDIVMPPEFVSRAVAELLQRRLDYLIPYTSIKYLSEHDTDAVIRGERNPADCAPVNTLYSRRPPSNSGALGLVRRTFLQRHGGLVEGFKGWGGEDNAWNRKVALLGRWAPTARQDQHVHHLYHAASGGYVMAVASAANPHYADNVALLGRVWSAASATQFERDFPAAPAAAGALTRYAPRDRAPAEQRPVVWTYWEGQCPDWIRACRQTISAHAPDVRLLTPDSFDRLRDRDRDIDLTRLHVAHRADFIRAFLLARYGGLWVDADCVAMRSLEPILDQIGEEGCDFIAHRERSGIVSNGFIAARPESRIAAAYYARVGDALRRRQPLGWTTLGSEPLTAVLGENPHGWRELPTERVQPICWSRPAEFFEQRDDAGHDRALDREAICYMMSNTEITRYLAAHPQANLLADNTFFRYLLRRAMGGAAATSALEYERAFAADAEIYRSHNTGSVSGPGSTLGQTQELRARLPMLLESLGAGSLLDAPCGDFNWMQHVDLRAIDYIGVDVFAEVIADNQGRHASARRRFRRADIVRDRLPRADAILCRDLLPHLSFADVKQVLHNFRDSGATWLLTTTFTNDRPNVDTAGCAWRTLNLTLPPFNFPAPARLINEKCTENGGIYRDKCLGVWKLGELPL